ncbi:MAG: hypothetical protein RLZZ263_258 [Cyanobacteriota bacterium]
MVNASLNWASIVGIVLAVGGALLYFMRSFKPALARDYDVFFAAVGLLCGGILFFQGWRLDPILQFGQFLLAGSAVFFAYESVRLRGVTTEQARRSSYFDDDEPVPAGGPYRPRMGGQRWGDDGVDRFDEPQGVRRRIPSRDPEEEADDFYRPRRNSRAAIPERAASRRPPSQDDWSSSDRASEGPGPSGREEGFDRSRYSAGGRSSASAANDFGARRRDAADGPEFRRGSRPSATSDGMPRSTRRSPAGESTPGTSESARRGPGAIPQGSSPRSAMPQGSPMRGPSRPTGSRDPISDADFSPVAPPSSTGSGPSPEGPAGSAGSSAASNSPRPRDNSSRFDD